MLDIVFLITCALLAYAGIKFVLWAFRFSLPVPLGSFMWLRFFFWWTLTLFAAVAAYFGVAVAACCRHFEILNLDQRLDSSVLLLGGLVLSAPYWAGLINGINLQASHRWSE
ncbi:hypothetical protein [Ruegeria arenilitoris]|uniref:hypothetical protein n=1 Tax=Ruegeria arenilitoris TaxID=1173585 RepID=UPI00147A2DB1|nr:hypothetical protein [Ruegeria arenilitoris]